MEKLLLALFSALIGFFISQSMNILKYFRRPKFKTVNFSDGVISSYTGSPPETPSEVTLGFFLENRGYNAAKNTRIFVSQMECSVDADAPLEEMSLTIKELKRPVDVIPAGESVMVILGVIKSDDQELHMQFQDDYNYYEDSDFIGCETRFKKVFGAKFHIMCDDPNSNSVIKLKFEPMFGDWSCQILEDMAELRTPSQITESGWLADRVSLKPQPSRLVQPRHDV